MKSRKKLWSICWEVYKEMYKQATPALDFEKAFHDGITAKENWFMKHYLSPEKQQKIIDDTCRKYHLTKREKHRIQSEVYLGSAPSSVKHNP